MRICFVNRFFWPDVSASSQLLTDLATHLAQRGHEVRVVTSRQQLDAPAAALQPQETHAGVRIVRVWSSTFGRGWLPGRALDYLTFYAAAALALLRHLRRGDALVALTDPPLLGPALGPFARLRGARLVNWLNDVYPEIAERLGALGPLRAIARPLAAWRDRSLRRAALNVAIGERMHEFLQNRAAGTAVTVIHNWSPELQASAAAASALRTRLGIDGRIVFGYSGNLGRAHPFAALLEAGERLRDRADLHFLFIGSGARYAELAREVRARALPNWSFLPRQPREALAAALGAPDVHIVTLDPRLEGLVVPSKIYGVFAAGRPCVFLGHGDGEVARLLARHQCGLTAPAEDASATQAALLRLAGDAALRQQLGANARRAFEDHFSPAQALQRWEASFATLPSG